MFERSNYHDEGLLDARGQRAHDGLDALDDLGEARVDVRAPRECTVTAEKPCRDRDST
jgi:hypothetical protein